MSPATPTTTRPVRLRVNGREAERPVEVRRSLVDFLREDLGLTGTHVGCEHGVCRACTVLVDGAPVRSCLLLAVQADGAEVLTVEGLASPRRAPPTPGGLPGAPRPPVRVLHPRDPAERLRLPRGESKSDGLGDPGDARGPPLPLHRLRAHRPGHPRRRGDLARAPEPAVTRRPAWPRRLRAIVLCATASRSSGRS